MNIINKDWMALPRASPTYISGVDSFLDLAFQKTAQGQEILCPCKKCLNRYWYHRATVKEHLIVYGFVEGYTEWVFHGEGLSMYSQDLPSHYWNSTNAKSITKTNANDRKSQRNMCTVSKKSFASKRKQMQDANENNQPPTNRAFFIETRKRQPNKTYKEFCDDTSNKISQMQAVQSQQNSGNQSDDAFSVVMGGTRPGSVMLYGRSITPTNLKGISGDSSIKAYENFIEGIKEQIRKEVRKEMEELLAAHMSSMQQQFHFMISQQFHFIISQLQALVPGMNVNQVPGSNLNLGSPSDANSAPSQAICAQNTHSSASSHESQGQ